jgi:hypothetical protein
MAISKTILLLEMMISFAPAEWSFLQFSQKINFCYTDAHKLVKYSGRCNGFYVAESIMPETIESKEIVLKQMYLLSNN